MQGHAPHYPVTGDADLGVTEKCGMLRVELTGELGTGREREHSLVGVGRFPRAGSRFL